jgi:hypothetical protein
VGTLSGTTGWCLRVSSRELCIALAGLDSIACVLVIEVRLSSAKRWSKRGVASARLPIAPATFLLARHATDEPAKTMSAQTDHSASFTPQTPS